MSPANFWGFLKVRSLGSWRRFSRCQGPCGALSTPASSIGLGGRHLARPFPNLQECDSPGTLFPCSLGSGKGLRHLSRERQEAMGHKPQAPGVSRRSSPVCPGIPALTGGSHPGDRLSSPGGRLLIRSRKAGRQVRQTPPDSVPLGRLTRDRGGERRSRQAATQNS